MQHTLNHKSLSPEAQLEHSPPAPEVPPMQIEDAGAQDERTPKFMILSSLSSGSTSTCERYGHSVDVKRRALQRAHGLMRETLR